MPSPPHKRFLAAEAEIRRLVILVTEVIKALVATGEDKLGRTARPRTGVRDDKGCYM
ncbi:hypothetical protein GCM10027610_104260 [Dactylosporangium cerinum]